MSESHDNFRKFTYSPEKARLYLSNNIYIYIYRLARESSRGCTWQRHKREKTRRTLQIYIHKKLFPREILLPKRTGL